MWNCPPKRPKEKHIHWFAHCCLFCTNCKVSFDTDAFTMMCAKLNKAVEPLLACNDFKYEQNTKGYAEIFNKIIKNSHIG